MIKWIKDWEPATKRWAMGCITLILVTLIIAAAYSGDFDLLLSLFDKVKDAKK
jgi:hypothetical protein